MAAKTVAALPVLHPSCIAIPNRLILNRMGVAGPNGFVPSCGWQRLHSKSKQPGAAAAILFGQATQHRRQFNPSWAVTPIPPRSPVAGVRSTFQSTGPAFWSSQPRCAIYLRGSCHECRVLEASTRRARCDSPRQSTAPRANKPLGLPSASGPPVSSH